MVAWTTKKITKALSITAHHHPMWIWHLPHIATLGLKLHRATLSRRSQWSEPGWPRGIWQWSKRTNPGRKDPEGKGWESARTAGREGDTREEKLLLCPPRCPACRLGLAQSLPTRPPADKSPVRLIKMQIPGSLPQTYLISVFGIQAQE